MDKEQRLQDVGGALRLLVRIAEEQSGANMLEYALIVALIALTLIASMTRLSGTFGLLFQAWVTKVTPYWTL